MHNKFEVGAKEEEGGAAGPENDGRWNFAKILSRDS